MAQSPVARISFPEKEKAAVVCFSRDDKMRSLRTRRTRPAKRSRRRGHRRSTMIAAADEIDSTPTSAVGAEIAR